MPIHTILQISILICVTEEIVKCESKIVHELNFRSFLYVYMQKLYSYCIFVLQQNISGICWWTDGSEMHSFHFPKEKWKPNPSFSAITSFKAAAWLPVLPSSGGTLSLAWTMSNDSALWKNLTDHSTVSFHASPSCAACFHYPHSPPLQQHLQTCK